MPENDSTLLAYLAPWIDETVASKALAHILDSSEASREGLARLLKDGGVNVAAIDDVQTEVNGPGTGRVDIVCNSKGHAKPPVLIEVKFLAELTSNQPSGYLDWLLTDDEESVLLFVVPESRIGLLWPDLKNRAEQGGKKFVEVDAEHRCMRVDGTRCHLMVVSWRTLLDSMANRSRTAGEHPGIEADIQQLSGLARRKNDEAAPPFPARYLEMGHSIEDRREQNLRDLVNRVIEKSVQDGWADRTGLSVSRPSAAYPYGRYFRFRDTTLTREVWLGVHNENWKQEGIPLWLCFFDSHDLEVLHNLGDQVPGRLNRGYAPINLKPGAEMNHVVDDVVSQVKYIYDLIKNPSSTN